MRKEEGLKLVFTFVFLIYFISFVSAVIPAGQCAVVPRAECRSDLMNYIVMGLSAQTNAHVETASGSYPYVVCCAIGRGDLTCSGDGSNKIVGISSSTNAHASIPPDTNFLNSVCYEDFSCSDYIGSCPATGKNITLLSLSSPTNAHAGNISSYPPKICCSSSAPSRCDLKSASWLLTETIQGVNVRLRVVGNSGCDGMVMGFSVYEVDPTTTTSAQANPRNVAFIGSTATATWEAEWLDDGPLQGEPEYAFNAFLRDYPLIGITSSNQLLVKEMDELYCEERVVCDDYLSKEECESDADLCNVAGQSGPAEVDCSEEDITCQCMWNQAKGSCEFAWDEISCEGPGTTGCGYGCTLCRNATTNDNYCSLGNTCPTGDSPISDGDGRCEFGEGCLSSDCRDGDLDTCEKGTYCSEGRCYSDVAPLTLGNCQISQEILKDCDTEPVGSKVIKWTGIWTGNPETMQGPAYEACIAGGQSTVACPAQAQLPFFGNLALISSLAVISLVYIFINLKSKKKK